MAKDKLTAKRVEHEKRPGLYSDGAGLYLQVTRAGAKSWVFRYTDEVKHIRTMGLGATHTVSLNDAREEADKYRQLRKAGRDPWQERDKQRKADADRIAEAAQAAQVAQPQVAAEHTFKACALAYVATHEAVWKNPKHRQQWRNTLETYVYPLIGSMHVAAIKTPDVLRVLQQPHPKGGTLWNKLPETAVRVRGRIEQVLDYADALDLRKDNNPARWDGRLKKLLPARAKVRAVEHHAALPYAHLPDFMTRLSAQTFLSARALEFAILTAARSGEVLGASWSEIDLDDKVWSIPGERMKAGKPHRVPLSQAALDVLAKAATFRRKGDDWVFPGESDKKHLSNMAMTMMLRRLKVDATAHGFRSTFRDWAAETTAHPSYVVEMALAHTIGNKVEAAYRRGDLFEKRRQLMTDWATYCMSDEDREAFA